MNVELTPELEQLVQSKIDTGRYHSASDVMQEALNLMKARDLANADIKSKIAIGIASAKAGRLSDGDAFFAELEAELLDDIRLKN